MTTKPNTTERDADTGTDAPAFDADALVASIEVAPVGKASRTGGTDKAATYAAGYHHARAMLNGGTAWDATLASLTDADLIECVTYWRKVRGMADVASAMGAAAFACGYQSYNNAEERGADLLKIAKSYAPQANAKTGRTLRHYAATATLTGVTDEASLARSVRVAASGFLAVYDAAPRA